MQAPQSTEFGGSRARRHIERMVGYADFVIGLVLTFGGLAFATWWRARLGGFGQLRAFYLHTGWAFGALELLAGAAMIRRWPTRWILQMLPLVVPVVAYQFFILRFIYHRL
jgi:hypothetical protein